MTEEFVKVTFKGLAEAQRRVTNVQKAVMNPDIHKMVQGMAGIWQSNFDTEGGSVGGWWELAEATKRLRASRGFDPEHPILVQTGALKRAAVTGLLNVNGPRVLTYKGVMMSYVPNPFGATLTISGPKVDNQFRIRDVGYSQPARPFWFVNNDVEAAATNALHDSIEKGL